MTFGPDGRDRRHPRIVAMAKSPLKVLLIGMSVVLPLFAGSVLLPSTAGMSTYVTASSGIGLVAATMGLGAGIVAVLIACGAAVLLEMAPVGEFHIEQRRDAVALALFAANGLTVAVIGSLLHAHRSRQASPAVLREAESEAPEPPRETHRSPLPSDPGGPLSLRREPLTEREAEVLTLLATGMSNAEIGAELFISVNTVKSHLKNVYGKLGVDNRTRALSTALELGVISAAQPGPAATQARGPARHDGEFEEGLAA